MMASLMISLLLVLAAVFSFQHHVRAIPLNEFYPFGEDAGDQFMDHVAYYHHSPPIKANVTTFPYFGKHHDTLFVSSVDKT